MMDQRDNPVTIVSRSGQVDAEHLAPSSPTKNSKSTFKGPELRRLLSLRQLREFGIRWSRETIFRREAANTFPRRVYLSSQTVAWFEDEIVAWLEAKAAERLTRIYKIHD